ncbi:MAG: glycosyltransferase [Candidatus Ancillula sp.]|jgi:cellulose synthase/poly-beta-1,6-N-acetylglucosamine synthase-like glycosyltransferase|nr:glycosyltransferase [Candidatus Ancillula sp.]
MGLLFLFDYSIVAIGAVGFAYQAFCIIVGLFGKPVIFLDAPPKNYAIIISARNESAVISHLLESIADQDYDANFLDVWVCADNCDDNTAQICRDAGAFVVERFNKQLVGKGYSLSYLFDNMQNGTFGESEVQSGPDNMTKSQVRARTRKYEAFLILDADNLLEKNYITEMNKAFSAGNKIVTSYRNSKNFSSNWISSGSALWFVRESRLLNNSRMMIGASCHVGGTGFMFARSIMERNNGWKHHLLTEDLEFTMDCVLNGDKVGYCGTAMLYDEQPITFSQSWRQRLRWSKGFLQVFRNYGPKLIKKAFQTGSFSCLDLTILIFPWVFLEVIRIFIGSIYIALGFVSPQSQFNSLTQMGMTILSGGALLLIIACITIISERKKIGASRSELLAYLMAFPLYVLSYIPISFVAIFSKVEWKPIKHGLSADTAKDKAIKGGK